MSEVDKSVSLNIAILPDEAIRQRAIRFSQQISAAVPVGFILNETNLFPHITIYQAHFPVRNIPLLKEKLREITLKTQPFEIRLEKLSISYETFIFWSCIKTPHLQQLHNQTVAIANPLREGLVLPHLARVPAISPEDEKDKKKYGSLLIGPRFTPHLTLTRVTNPADAQKALDIIQNPLASFRPTAIVLAYLGDHGTVNGIISTYPLAA